MGKIAKPSKTGKYYAQRNKKGQIVKWVSIKTLLAADRRKKPKNRVKTCQGHKGDQ